MVEITYFVLVLSFGVGLAAVAVSAQIYRRYGFDYLRAHLAIVICFNLMILVNIVTLYIFNRPEGTVPDGVEAIAGTGNHFLVPLLQLLAGYFFIQIIWGLLGKPVTAAVRKTTWGVITGYVAVQGAAIAGSLTNTVPRLPRTISHLVWFATVALIYALLLGTLRQVRRVPEKKRRYALGTYWVLLLALITGVIVLIALNYRGILTITRYNFVTVFVVVIMNAVPILYLGWFAEQFHGTPARDWTAIPDPARLFDRYEISPREQEIIKLICSGKSNKEIADELFVTLQTVKDHVHRIFKKTGVKNRVQLVGLFLNPASNRNEHAGS